jgi:exodeoxyribonuclease VIII
MSDKVFGGYKEPKKGKEKELNLEHLVIAIEAPNAKAAAILIEAEFIKQHLELSEHYFAVKVFEDRPGLPRGPLNEFISDYFEHGACWNKELKDMEPVNPPAGTKKSNPDPDFIEVSKLPADVRSALLALFSRTSHITKHEYGQALDLVNDTESSYAKELAEAISRSQWILALYEEKALQLITAVRTSVPTGSQWPVFKKYFDTWNNAPAEKRDGVERKAPLYYKRPDTDEFGDLFTLDKLNELCAGGCVEITKVEFLQLKEARKAKELIDASLQTDADAKPGRTVFSVDELVNAPAAAPADNREELSPRQVEICLTINELISGHTNIIDREDADGLITRAGLTAAEIYPLLISDIESAEFLLSPDFSDEEIHCVATTLLERWSNDVSVRQKIAMEDIIFWRKEAIQSNKGPAPDPADLPPLDKPVPSTALSFKQQLMLAAVQGLCANPAHATSFDELSSMALHLAETLDQEEA